MKVQYKMHQQHLTWHSRFTANKMQRFLIYLFLKMLYMFHLIYGNSYQQYCLTIPEAV